MKHNDPSAAADEDARLDETACEPEPEAAEAREDDGDPDTFELELDGQTHTLPAALKGAFLRQADYTKKTQELAAHRRALEAEKAALAQAGQAAAGASQARVHLAALDHQLAGFQGVDWQALAQRDPQGAQALWGRYQTLAQTRGQMAQAVAQHEHGRALQAHHKAAEAMAEAGRALSREIPGWSPELAAKLADYAIAQGVTLDELKTAADPRLWKVLHKAFQAEEAGKGEAAARVPAVRPAVSVSGAAVSGGGVRDDLATKDWMRRRNDQVRKGR